MVALSGSRGGPLTVVLVLDGENLLLVGSRVAEELSARGEVSHALVVHVSDLLEHVLAVIGGGSDVQVVLGPAALDFFALINLDKRALIGLFD